MYDLSAPSSQRALAEYIKPDVSRQLLRYAMWRTRQEADAKDLVADVFIRVCDPDDEPWEPAKGSLFRHMRRLMDWQSADDRRVGFGKYEIVDPESEAFERAVQPSPRPDAELQAKRRLAWLRGMMAALIAKIGQRDKLAMRLYDLGCEGRMDEPEEYAEAIYEVPRRLRFHGLPMRAAWDKREALRMAGLRDAAERAS